MKRDATGKFVSNWDSQTKQRVSVFLTHTARRSLDKEAHKRGISRSEVIEHFARSLETERHPVVVFQDVTDRKQAEVALQQQAEALKNLQKWLEAVLDLMPTPTVFIEPGTAKVTFSNRIANELAGGDFPKNKSLDEYPDAYYCTEANGDRIPTERMPAVLIAQGERLENYELNWHTPGGIRSTLCWGETLPAMYGHPAIGIAMFQDVTRLKQIEENLRQTEERLQLALSSAQMVAWDMDLEDGSIEQIAVAHTDPAKLEWAHQIRQKYPLNPNDPRGAALTLRTGQSDILPDIPDELLVQAARDPEHLEILRLVGFRSVMTVPLRTQSGILGVISFVAAESGRRYDSTDLQLAEELAHRASLAIDNAQLYRMAQRDRAKAESANRVKDEFLAVLSHELRSPLNPILGWTKLLRTKRLNPTKAEQALETIERNAKLQAQLIEDLLDVSRILQVLLSDIGMPETDGYMMMRRVRTLPPEQGGQIPAIALTAYAGEINQQQALAAGFQQHVSKPVEPDRLISIIADLVGSVVVR